MLHDRNHRADFGWDLPPGVTQRMIDEQCGVDEKCEECGEYLEDCICYEEDYIEPERP